MGPNGLTLPAAAPSPAVRVPRKVSNPFSKTAWTVPPSRPLSRPPRLPTMPLSEDPSLPLHHKEHPLLTHPTRDTLHTLQLMGR